MLRIATETRPNWKRDVESKGLLFHSLDDEPYWDESAYYLFEVAEIDQIERATAELDEMCLEAVEHIINERRLDELAIPGFYHKFVERSWEHDEHTIYGRFDLSYDGVNPPKLLEYNADTPTALLEAAVIQWFWSKDLLAPLGPLERTQFDQFNSIHERLIEAWGRVRNELGPWVAFGALSDSVEDVMTVSYLRDTAIQAGLKTSPIAVSKIGWNPQRKVFTDLNERPIEILFKLYPWEWMLSEPFGRHLVECTTRWLEPPWKMILSNKGILPILSELFPDSPYLLQSSFEPIGSTYVSKPIHSREGANVTIVKDGQILSKTDGEYGNSPRIYQAYHPLPRFGDRHAVIGSWMVNGYPCGIGLREDNGPITRNTSRFLPHLFRKSRGMKPPTMGQARSPDWAGGSAPPVNDPLWDRWLDR
jgi:glutathionylspermidine synthase